MHDFYFLNADLNSKLQKIEKIEKVNCVTPSDNTKVWNALNNSWPGHFKNFP